MRLKGKIKYMKIDLSEDDIKFIKNAFNYVVLSLDGNKIDNSDLNDIDKCRILGQCFYLMQMFDNPIEDNKKESANSNDYYIDDKGNLKQKSMFSPEMQMRLNKAMEDLNPWRDVFK